MKENASFQPTARHNPKRAGEPTTERRPHGAPGPHRDQLRPSGIAIPPRGSAPREGSRTCGYSPFRALKTIDRRPILTQLKNQSLEVASASSRMDGLLELRRQLAVSIDLCVNARDKATLAARYLDVVAAIADEESKFVPTGVTGLDQLKVRREQRARERGRRSG